MKYLANSCLFLVLAGASACSLVFNESGEAGVGAATDAAQGDSAAPTQACAVRGPDIPLPVFDLPVDVGGVWGDGDSWMGALSADEELIAFSRYTDATFTDIFMSTKSGSGVFLEASEWRSTVNPEHPVFLERDGLALWYVTENSAGKGSLFRADLETSDNSPFSLNYPAVHQSWLWLSVGQERAYYLNDNVLTRASSEGGSGFDSDDAYINLGDTLQSFTMSCDEREVIFQKANAEKKHDLFWATRNSINEQFSDPVEIMSINTANDEAHPWLSMDGQRLYLDYDSDLSGISVDDNNAGVQMATRQN